MITTEHTQTLAQMLETADRTKPPSKEVFRQILEEFGRETMSCITWRASLRVLPLIAFKPLEQLWPKSTIGHCFAVIRVNIVLQNFVRKHPYVSMDFSAVASTAYRTARAYNADTTAADTTAADVAAYAAAVCDINADSVDTAAYIVAADTYSAARVAGVAGDSKPLIDNMWGDILALTQHINIEALFQRDLWQQVPAFFEDHKQKLHEELIQHNLDFVWQDLENLWQGKFLNPVRFARYAENLTEDILRDAEQLRLVIEGKVDTQANASVRVLLLGPGGAGKTTLAKRLKKEPTDQPSASTISIEHGKLEVELSQEFRNELALTAYEKINLANLQLFLWDFGGQTIFHNLHRGFMRRENCVYVLVVDSRHEQSADQWLQQLQFHLQGDDSLPKNASPEHASLAGNAPLATVFLITNEYELVARQQNERRLLREFPRLLTKHSFINLSCFFDENWEGDKKAEETRQFEKFLKRLVEQCVKSQHVLVKENAQTIRLLNDEFREKHTWRKSEVIQRLEEHQLVNNADDALQRINKMQDLGQLIQLGKVEDYCINPAWLSSVAYELINAKALKDEYGHASANLIDQLHGELGDKLMRFLVENHVAAPLSENGQAPYFFPDAASENEPETVQSLIAHHHWQIHYELDFLPLGFRSQLLTRLLNDNAREFTINITRDAASEVWHEGFIAHHQHKTAQMLVQYDTDLRRIAVYLCADNAQEVDAFASMLNSLHNALACVIKPHTKQPRIITPLKIEKDYPEDHNQQAYFALAEKLKDYTIFIAAVEESIVDKNATLKAAEMQITAAKALAEKQIAAEKENTQRAIEAADKRAAKREAEANARADKQIAVEKENTQRAIEAADMRAAKREAEANARADKQIEVEKQNTQRAIEAADQRATKREEEANARAEKQIAAEKDNSQRAIEAANQLAENSKEEADKNRKAGFINTVVGTFVGAVVGALSLAYFTDYLSNNTTDPTNKNQSIIAPEPNNKSVSETHINNTVTPIKTAQPESKNEAQTDSKKVTTADNNKVAPATTKKPELIENTRENTPTTKKVMAAESIKKNLIEGKQAASDENSSKNVP